MFKYIFYPLMTWIREAVFDMDTCGAFLLKIQGKSLSRLDATFMVTVPKNSSILYIISEQKHTLIISTKPNSKIFKQNLAKILPHAKVLFPLVKPQYSKILSRNESPILFKMAQKFLSQLFDNALISSSHDQGHSNNSNIQQIAFISANWLQR